jgi:hypothetical protein
MTMKSMRARTIALAMTMIGGLSMAAQPGWSAPACPFNPVTDAAKSHKLFLYFPLVDDATFPNYSPGVSPAKTFDVADLDPGIGTTNQLRNRIYDVVTDDYCEFNVEVQQTTTNPETMASPPARRTTVAVGSDPNPAWGVAQEVDLGDKVNVDFARAWAGTYVNCEGGNSVGGCSPAGALLGVNSTLDRWAEAIGGTAAHEAGHTYGLLHSDDNTPTACGGEPGAGPKLGEDDFKKHLMPSGCNLSGEDRAGYRRHISDRAFGLLATNVGLTIETMHNWDLINPNSADASSLTMDFLSKLPAVTTDWTYGEDQSPWVDPVVSAKLGTVVWQGTTWNHFQITWSKPNFKWAGTPGLLPAGLPFHIGATFTGVDFNQPDPIIIQNITLFDAAQKPLKLHPRLPMYDSGTLDPATGDFVLHIYPMLLNPQLILQESTLYQLPRVASIESMIGEGKPLSFDGLAITPWSSTRCVPAPNGDGTSTCRLGNLTDRPHVLVTRSVGQPGVYDCSAGVPRLGGLRADSPLTPDGEGPVCAGTSRDPFPSTTLYLIATFVDPKAEHWDPVKRAMVTGPVTSKVFYQFAGVRDPQRLRR